MITRFALAFITAAMHRVRGAENNLFTGINDRIIAILAIMAAAFLYHHSAIDAAIIGAGYFVYIIFGWGSYFTAPGDFDFIINIGPREKEIPPIDWLISKLPPYRAVQNFAGMFLRGLFAAPTFFALGWHHHAFITASVETVCFAVVMACAYSFTPLLARLARWNYDYTAYAEGITGCAFGVAVGALI